MEEIMRSDWKILSNPENLEENSKHVALARESRNQTFKYSRKHQKPDGTTVIADVTVQLLDDGKEKPALLFMLEDVTERETALARDRHLAAILDNAQEAVVSVDDKPHHPLLQRRSQQDLWLYPGGGNRPAGITADPPGVGRETPGSNVRLCPNRRSG
jgi:PAS domain-containing protein